MYIYIYVYTLSSLAPFQTPATSYYRSHEPSALVGSHLLWCPQCRHCILRSLRVIIRWSRIPKDQCSGMKKSLTINLFGQQQQLGMFVQLDDLYTVIGYKTRWNYGVCPITVFPTPFFWRIYTVDCLFRWRLFEGLKTTEKLYHFGIKQCQGFTTEKAEMMGQSLGSRKSPCETKIYLVHCAFSLHGRKNCGTLFLLVSLLIYHLYLYNS